MSLSKNEVMNEIYNAGLITLGAVATSMVSKKTNERRTCYEFRVEHTEVGSSSRWWVGVGEISSEKGLHSEHTFQINGERGSRRTIQRDSLCESWVRVSQTGQERLRERDGKTQQGYGRV